MDRNDYKLRLLNVFSKIKSTAKGESVNKECISSKVSKGIIASIIKSNKAVLIEVKGKE